MSVNILGRNKEYEYQQQYIFDIENARLCGGAGDLLSNRLFMIDISNHLWDVETIGILHDIAAKHPCVKTRAVALRGLNTISPDEAERAKAWADETVLELASAPLIMGNYARNYSGA